MTRVAASLLGLALLAGPARGETTEEAPLSFWRVQKGSPGSRAQKGEVVVRAASPVVWEPVELGVSRARLEAEVSGVPAAGAELRAVFRYDDGAEEAVAAPLPAGRGARTLVLRPKWWKGRVARAIALEHAEPGVEVKLKRFEATTEKGAATLAGSTLAGAQLQGGDSIRNRVLWVRPQPVAANRPWLAGVRGTGLSLVASRNLCPGEGPDELVVTLLDAKGVALKSVRRRVSDAVGEIAVPFEGADPAQAARIVFEPGGACPLAIRRIAVTGAPAP